MSTATSDAVNKPVNGTVHDEGAVEERAAECHVGAVGIGVVPE